MREVLQRYIIRIVIGSVEICKKSRMVFEISLVKTQRGVGQASGQTHDVQMVVFTMMHSVAYGLTALRNISYRQIYVGSKIVIKRPLDNVQYTVSAL
jgi:hypothetical protein